MSVSTSRKPLFLNYPIVALLQCIGEVSLRDSVGLYGTTAIMLCRTGRSDPPYVGTQDLVQQNGTNRSKSIDRRISKTRFRRCRHEDRSGQCAYNACHRGRWSGTCVGVYGSQRNRNVLSVCKRQRKLEIISTAHLADRH